MKALLSILLLLTSCGWGVSVEIEHVSQEEIDSLCDEKYRCQAYTTWSDFGACTIYIKPIEEYDSERTYNELLGHELRHCFEGEFH